MVQLRLNLKVPDVARACSTYVTSPSHSRMLCCGVSGNTQNGSDTLSLVHGCGVVTCSSMIIHQAHICVPCGYPYRIPCLSDGLTPVVGFREPLGRLLPNFVEVFPRCSSRTSVIGLYIVQVDGVRARGSMRVAILCIDIVLCV